MSVENKGGEVIKDRTRARGISEGKKMAKKGRNERKTKQPRLLQFHFFNLFFFPPKKLDARA